MAINARDGNRLDEQVGEFQARGYKVMGTASDVSRSVGCDVAGQVGS